MEEGRECPFCPTGRIVKGFCGNCGITQKINEQSGNPVFFRNGRLIAMPQDKKDREDMMRPPDIKPEDDHTVEDKP